MLTPTIQDELRARFERLGTPLVEDNADGDAILAHIVSDRNRAEIAGFFLEEAVTLQLEMLAAYGRFLLAAEVPIEPNIPASKFVDKLFKKEANDGQQPQDS